MLSVFLLLSEVSCLRSLEGTQQKHAKFRIEEFSPKTVQGKGGDVVSITIDKNISSLVFCRFGDKSVAGRKTGDFTINCVSPKLSFSEVLLSVSEDKQKWAPPVTLGVIPEPNSSSIFFAFLTLFVFVGVLFAVKVVFGRKRKRTHKKKKLQRSALNEPLEGKKRAKKKKQELI